MPELPEVTTIVRLLNTQIQNKEIRDVEIKKSTVIKNPSFEFKKGLEGLKINEIKRRGKCLVFFLSNNKFMVSHLAMEGKWYYYEKDNETNSSYARVIFHFKSGDKLIYDDSRMFGKLYFFKENAYEYPPLSKLGIEPLEEFDKKKVFDQIVKQKNHPIKEVIMDQHIITGIGNIYANEILFKEKIHPLTKAKDVTFPVFEKMIKTSKEILEIAIKNNGSTIRTYHPGKNMEGNFQNFIKCYGEEICPNCHNHFTKIFIAGRGTTFCYHCQKNVSMPIVKVITSKIGAGKTTALQILKEKNQHIISCDTLVKELYKLNDVQEKINDIFKTKVFSNGEVDRNLFTKCLSDEKLKNKFDKYFYEILEEYLYDKLLKFEKNEIVFVEVPLLDKLHIKEYASEIIFIDVNEEKQKENLICRGNFKQHLVDLNNKIDFAKIKKESTIIINNNKSLDDFKKSILNLIKI